MGGNPSLDLFPWCWNAARVAAGMVSKPADVQQVLPYFSTRIGPRLAADAWPAGL
jgi:hypothetical protein